MDSENAVLLPHILQALSAKTKFCDTYENLCHDIKFVMSDANFDNEEIEECIESALSVGQNLGILTLTNDLVRMPLNYTKNKKVTKKTPTAVKKNSVKTTSALRKAMRSVESLSEAEKMLLMTQPRRTRNAKPATKKVRGRKPNRGRSARRGSRKRSRNSRRRSQHKRR